MRSEHLKNMHGSHLIVERHWTVARQQISRRREKLQPLLQYKDQNNSSADLLSICKMPASMTISILSFYFSDK